MGGGGVGREKWVEVYGGENQWEAWNWSWDLKANERPWKKLYPMAQTNKQINKQKKRTCNSMTELAQCGWFSENIKWIKPIQKKIIYSVRFLWHTKLHIKLQINPWHVMHKNYDAPFTQNMFFKLLFEISFCLSFWCRHNQRQNKEQEFE